ncbi:alcohol dehydrogenase catalytic domain-containing protein [Streptomyces sp. NPDC093105]|uniref:alcohol dehydrogenase catalytic domain-containing protein n=1 Tax=Streptomyces sp. NPDC093105 TaxID=3366029 RepID=UPI0037F8170B
MRAAVFQGPGKISGRDVPDPDVDDPGDAIVGVDVVTVCGTEPHIRKGEVPEVSPGRVLGHEAVGTVVETGRDVRPVRPGDRVLISRVSACGVVGGTQAECVRVPFADLSVHPLPNVVDSVEAVLPADICPTAHEVGVLNGGARPGDTVVVVGGGPVGLAAACLSSPGRIIAVDLAESFETCARMVRPGGRVAGIGLHGKPASLHLDDRFALERMEEAYDVFGRAADTGAVEVALRTGSPDAR